jgi:hypothetical protein
LVKNLLIFGFPIAIAIGLIALSNLIRFGSFFKTGYHLAFPTLATLMSTPLLTGMGGLLINPTVGILIYVPWVAMMPLLWRRFWRSYRNEAALVLGMSLANYIFFAKYAAWSGGWAIGPRMLYAIIPFLIVPLAVLLEQGPFVWRSVKGQITAGLCCAALLIQLVLLPYPESRYFQMERFNQDHGMVAWWTNKPLLEAITAVPELVFGRANQERTPAHAYLFTFENSVNLVRGDLWLLKATLFGLPRGVALLLAMLLLLSFSLAMFYSRSLLRRPVTAGPGHL